MTKQELNRDIKRLLKTVSNIKKDGQYHDNIEKIVKPEFMRLYLADRSFEYMNKDSIKIMLRLNLRYRFEAHHQFGRQISFKGTDF